MAEPRRSHLSYISLAGDLVDTPSRLAGPDLGLDVFRDAGRAGGHRSYNLYRPLSIIKYEVYGMSITLIVSPR